MPYNRVDYSGPYNRISNPELEFIKNVENTRVLIVYSNAFTANLAIFYYLLPNLMEKGGDLYNIIYSESATRTLEHTYRSLEKFRPEIAEILDMSNVIKIGRTAKIPFGKLYDFIPINNIHELTKTLENLGDLAIFHGFSILFAFMPLEIEFLDYIPNDTTFIAECNRCVYSNKLTLFFDVVLSAEEDDIGFNNYNVLSVLYSAILDITPGFNIRYEGKTYL